MLQRLTTLRLSAALLIAVSANGLVPTATVQALEPVAENVRSTALAPPPIPAADIPPKPASPTEVAAQTAAPKPLDKLPAQPPEARELSGSKTPTVTTDSLDSRMRLPMSSSLLDPGASRTIVQPRSLANLTPGCDCPPDQKPPTPTEVIPAPVESSDVCGVKNDSFIVPITPGIVYKDKASGEILQPGPHTNVSGTITVVAEPTDGNYVIKTGATAEWTLEFTNEECPPPVPVDVCPNLPGDQTVVPGGMTKDTSGNCTKPGQVLGETTTKPPTPPAPIVPTTPTPVVTPPQVTPVGHVLGQAASVSMPATLPATGGMSFVSQWLPMIAAVLTYGLSFSIRSRKLTA